MTCRQCKNFEKCIKEADYLGQMFDPDFDGEHYCLAKQFSAKTNADRIRAMSDEELVEWIYGRNFCDCICPPRINEDEYEAGHWCPENCKERTLK